MRNPFSAPSLGPLAPCDDEHGFVLFAPPPLSDGTVSFAAWCRYLWNHQMDFEPIRFFLVCPRAMQFWLRQQELEQYYLESPRGRLLQGRWAKTLVQLPAAVSASSSENAARRAAFRACVENELRGRTHRHLRGT
jgi:hypothetical protein